MILPPYDVVGRGEPLLMLSGYAVPAALLDPVKAPLTDRFTVITFDYPGSGKARRPLVPLSVPALAALAVRLLDHLGYRSAHVYGLSMGGLVAQELAIRFPERVRRLVLVSTSPGGPHAPRADPWTFLAALTALDRSSRCAIRVDGAAAQAFAASLHDASGRLHRIQADTLILHGDRDRVVRPGNARLLHRGIRSSTLQLVRGGGHFFAFEDPEAAAAPVLRWCAASALPGRRGIVSRVLEPATRHAAVPLGIGRGWLTTQRILLAASVRAVEGLTARRR